MQCCFWPERLAVSSRIQLRARSARSRPSGVECTHEAPRRSRAAACRDCPSCMRPAGRGSRRILRRPLCWSLSRGRILLGSLTLSRQRLFCPALWRQPILPARAFLSPIRFRIAASRLRRLQLPGTIFFFVCARRLQRIESLAPRLRVARWSVVFLRCAGMDRSGLSRVSVWLGLRRLRR